MEQCPFEFNFDPTTFKVGDVVSYRIPATCGDWPFVGTIVAVYDEHIEVLSDDPAEKDSPMKATRTSRPVVAA